MISLEKLKNVTHGRYIRELKPALSRHPERQDHQGSIGQTISEEIREIIDGYSYIINIAK